MAPDGIEEAARRYVPGAGPVSVERLGRGLVNESYRVVRDGRVYALRLPAARPAPVGVDREWECRVLAAASAAGIAAVVERCEPQLGVLVARWAEGSTLRADEARRPSAAAQVARLAQRVHAVPPPDNARILSPGDWIEYYRHALSRLPSQAMGVQQAPGIVADVESLAEQAERHLGALARMPSASRVLCHSDLHAANLVATARGLVVLDWEYAHVSEALWDLAGWACNSDLDFAARAHLLATYLGRPATGEEERRIEHLAWLYDYVCLLWSEVYCAAACEPDRRILERGRTLVARLSRTAGGGIGELPAH